MPDTSDITAARRALLEKYLRGEVTQTTSLSTATTPAQRAETLSARAPVVAIQPSGSKQPFFFLHGDWIRGAFFCFPLAHSIGKEQPFYISHPYKLADLEHLPTIEAIATEHLKAIRAIQPQGPYLLGGFCNGALLVHEMALQLHAQQEKVDLLVMMDPMEPVPPPARKRTYQAMRYLGNLLHVHPRNQLDWFLLLRYLDKYAKHVYRYMRYPHYRRLITQQRNDERIELLHLVYPHFSALLPSFQELRKDYEDTFNWLACEYSPNLYSGKITVFWNSEEPFHSFRRTYWRNMMREKNENDVDIHIVAGSHSTCKTDHLPDMAKHLGACLQQLYPSS